VYALPRTPIKETERRGARFEERHGEGATELDALEALHSGALQRILSREIERYHDAGLAHRIREAAGPLGARIADINRATRDAHESDLARIRAEWAQIEKRAIAWEESAKSIWQAIADDLEEAAPDPDDVNWPEPEDGHEDPDPLFDSTRAYLDQIDRYKAHQGKPTERKRRSP